ncbi:MAG: hypothetical protein AB4426_14575 [Xenococcaceae cyanobacterium]
MSTPKLLKMKHSLRSLKQPTQFVPRMDIAQVAIAYNRHFTQSKDFSKKLKQ